MRLLPAIAANALLLTTALGFGSALRRLFPPSFSIVDRLAFTLLRGLGLLGALLFDLGQAWFSRTAIVLVMLAGLFLGVVWLLKNTEALRSNLPKICVPLLPAAIVASVLLITAVGGLAEPTGDIKMDAIAYHFLGPKVWLRNGMIRPVIDEALTAFPATVETQYAAVMALGSQRAPGFYAVLALLSILLLTMTLALRSGLDPAGAWWVAALIFTMPVVYRGAFGGFVDVVYSGFVLAAARLGLDAERPAHYALFGMFCGFAMGTKYTGLIAAVLLAACVFFVATGVHGHNKMRVLKHLGIACIAATIVAAPWYLRNWALLGCPIYPPPPFLLRFFQVQYLPREALQRLLVRIWKEGDGMGRGPLSFFLLPFRLTYHTANFINGVGGIGLAPLALAPFGLLVRRKDWFASSLMLFTLLQTAAWFVTAQEARYLIHGYVVAAIFAVWGWRYVARAAPRFGPALARLAIVCSVLYGLFMIYTARVDDIHAAISSSFAQKRRSEEIPFVDSFDYLNRESSVQKVLILDPLVPPFYSDKSYLKLTGRLGEQTLPEANDPQQILSELPALHVSHVLDVKSPAGAFRLSDQPPGLALVFQRDGQRVYRVN
jgi:hypothetical protein